MANSPNTEIWITVDLYLKTQFFIEIKNQVTFLINYTLVSIGTQCLFPFFLISNMICFHLLLSVFTWIPVEDYITTQAKSNLMRKTS